MSYTVICPSCKEENIGSALLCKKCQTSLIGVPRIETPDAETTDSPMDLSTGTTALEGTTTVQPNTSILASHAAMLKSIHSWALSSLGLGVVHLFASGFLSAPWGILLILVGLSSFLFQSSGMFIIYAVTLGWAALSNVTSVDVFWIVFALFQFFLAYRVFQQYRHFHKAEEQYNEYLKTHNDLAPQYTDRSARFFPGLSTFFGCASIIGLVIIVLIAFVIAVGSQGKASSPSYFGFIEGLMVNFGVLGASVGLASLLSKYRLKWLAIMGLVAGLFTVLIEIVFAFFL